jgi:hypothetical protein
MIFMKTKYFILLSLIAICFTACDLDNSSNSTPEMSVFTSHINGADTLNIYSTDEGGVGRLDTIAVGDTIVFRMYLNGVTNNLTSFYIAPSDTASAKIILPNATSMDSLFSNTQSDYSMGKFIFLPKMVHVYFPVRYVAKKPSAVASIQLALYSDAIFDNSIGSNRFAIKLKTPIVAKRQSVK